jgi:hypothetical protein
MTPYGPMRSEKWPTQLGMSKRFGFFKVDINLSLAAVDTLHVTPHRDDGLLIYVV